MKRLGPRGIGSQRELCGRVVLDTNLLRGAPIAELEAIRGRGFALSISIEALREFWAQSLREGNYKMLEARVRKVAPLLDPGASVAFVGTALLDSIGTLPSNVALEARAFRESITAAWAAMRDDGLPREAWERIGRDLQAELDEDERRWLGHLARWAAIEAEVDAQEAIHGPFYDRARGIQKARNGLVDGTGAETVPPVEQRTAAFFDYIVAKFSRGAKANSNDFYDGRLLQHLGWPSFVATCDLRLIDFVESTGSVQRAWVRTPVELVEDRIARSVPWGKPARVIDGSFSRLPLKQLQQRQDAWRASLPKYAPAPTVPETVP